MKNVIPILLVIFSVFFAGCASTNYSAYEGGGVVEGTGGTKKTINGIDIWNNGSPPRKYKVIGIIDDSRRQTPLGMAGYENALVKKAKEAGGDGIIILDAHSELVGFYNSGSIGTATTTGSASVIGNTAYYHGNTTYQDYGSSSDPINNKITKAAVIRYAN